MKIQLSIEAEDAVVRSIGGDVLRSMTRPVLYLTATGDHDALAAVLDGAATHLRYDPQIINAADPTPPTNTATAEQGAHDE